MSQVLIEGMPQGKRIVSDVKPTILKVSEFFGKTLQGEGVSSGTPAAFLRMKDCTLDCVWCDTESVWKKGNPYSIEELLDLMESSGLVEDFKKGHHLVLTGGSPLKQQVALANMLAIFQIRFGFLPFIEVENECMLKPQESFSQFISQWNNSPKLSNSQMKKALRLKPEIIREMADMPNSWFKFVVAAPEDWREIKEDFLDPGLIDRHQIIIMPCGATQEELAKTREFAAEIAVRENVMFSDRLHVTIWDKKTGV